MLGLTKSVIQYIYESKDVAEFYRAACINCTPHYVELTATTTTTDTGATTRQQHRERGRDIDTMKTPSDIIKQ